MPQGIPKGLTREHVLKALAELDAGAAHPFGAPSGYDLVHEGKSYPPKAVIGLAARHLIGRVLQPDEFSSGVASGQAVHVLRELGFKVVRLTVDWTRAEVDLIVADYFEMLREECLGLPYNKTEHRKRLGLKLQNRNNGSIERKHQNISAVLVNMGLPYIDGYKPLGNFQTILAEAVEGYIGSHQGTFQQLADSKLLNPAVAPPIPVQSSNGVFVPPPKQIIVPRETSQPWLSRRGMRIDFARRDAENRRMGTLGEQFVVEIERKRLQEAGRDDLAKKVDWVAQSCGDGLGFDVLSFCDKTERERYVEVKTTGLGKFFPFYVTRNEVRCSEAMPDNFHLYRVFDFSRSAKVYVLPGALSKVCTLEPIQYRASL